MLTKSLTVASVSILLGAAGCAQEDWRSANISDTGYTGSSAAPGQRAEVITTREAQPAPKPAAKPEAAPQAKPTVADGRLRSSYAFPTGHQDTSVLLVERDLPAEIVAAQEFGYDIKVTNINHVPIQGVTVRDDCAGGLNIVRADPAPSSDKPPLVWALGDLKPGESRTIHVVGKTSSSEPFTSCASASYNSALCLTAPVVKPALRLTLSAPPEATPCDSIPVRLTVTNTGTGAARNVQVAYPLPEGWRTADGKTTAQFVIDALEASQSRDFTVNATAAKTGDFNYKATASGSPNLKAESAPASTVIRQAILDVKAEAPEHIYAGRPVTIKYTIANTGTAPANAPTFEAPLPQGVKFNSATDGGALRAGLVSWKLEPIPVKQSRSVSMTVEPGLIGGIETLGTAKAFCANPASAPVNISVFGIPALLLEVTDLVDPVPTGGETTYQVVITNQGSAPATNVKIVANLEAAEQFLSASGLATTSSPGTVTFEPIRTIPAKGVVTLKVNVKCTGEGDTRFKVTMTSDQLTRPVEETESTFLYR